MPKSPEHSGGTTEYSADVLRMYRTSDGYLPGMRDETREANDELAYYKTDKLLAGSPDFPPAAQLMAQMTKVCQALENEFGFNFTITDSMIVALADTGDAMEQVEEDGTISGKEFGRLVGEAITERGGTGTNTPDTTT
ncbi:hypothetical protein [Streptomyces sp. NPDC003247]|uniref:hypothetical protein n=1 Tax=Streptomyces sp. NPDC003247 TaxID=3364677 RepID=UPI00369D91F1